MAQLTINFPSGLATTPITPVTPTVGGDAFANDGKVYLKLINGANATTVTVAGVPCSHGRTANTVYNTLANKEYMLGPFDPSLFNDANGNVNVTYSQSTATTVCAVHQ